MIVTPDFFWWRLLAVFVDRDEPYSRIGQLNLGRRPRTLPTGLEATPRLKVDIDRGNFHGKIVENAIKQILNGRDNKSKMR